MRPLFLDLVRGDLHVRAEVVERVENSDDVQPVPDGPLDELAHGVVRIVAVAHDVLTAQKHLELRLLEEPPHGAQTLPRIFVEEAHAAVVGGASPDLH